MPQNFNKGIAARKKVRQFLPLFSYLNYINTVQGHKTDIFHKKTCFKPLKRQSQEMVKHTQRNCLSVFDHFAGLALKGLKIIVN